MSNLWSPRKHSKREHKRIHQNISLILPSICSLEHQMKNGNTCSHHQSAVISMERDLVVLKRTLIVGNTLSLKRVRMNTKSKLTQNSYHIMNMRLHFLLLFLLLLLLLLSLFSWVGGGEAWGYKEGINENSKQCITQFLLQFSILKYNNNYELRADNITAANAGGGVLSYVFGGYVLPTSSNLGPIFRNNFALKMIPTSRNRPIFYLFFFNF